MSISASKPKTEKYETKGLEAVTLLKASQHLGTRQGNREFGLVGVAINGSNVTLAWHQGIYSFGYILSQFDVWNGLCINSCSKLVLQTLIICKVL